MAITSPLVLTVNSISRSFTRVSDDNGSSKYMFKGAGFDFQINIRHSKEGKVGPGQMERHNVEFIHTNYAGTPLVPIIRNAFMTWRMPVGEDPATVLIALDAILSLVDTDKVALTAWAN